MTLAMSMILAMLLGTSMTDQALEKQAREIEGKLIAPCCWSQPVAQHYSEAADQIRQEVRTFLAEGRSEREILDHYVSNYGERILASPRAEGFNLLAYILPWASLLFGGFVLVTFLRRWRRRSESFQEAEAARAVPDEQYAKRLEQELRDLE